MAAGTIDEPAEAHAAGCEACFAWLETTDPLPAAVRLSRPDPVAAPPQLAAQVLAAWRTERAAATPRGWAAAAVLVLVAAFAASVALATSVSGSVVAGIWAGMGSLVRPVTEPFGAVLGSAAAILTEHPLWLAVLVLVGLAAALAWVRLDGRLEQSPAFSGSLAP
ncbi:MAG: hypothetical protein M3024_11465 [Candidatus Dormibacteraeota bacterium]|nr:hypothetical protein [Candidatus Dormibacteraeota bacterium]